MRRWTWIPAVILAVAAVITWRAFSVSVVHRPDVAVTPEMVRRGEYLARAGDCVSCHTASGHDAFAGGREFDLGRLGKLFSTNITPDKETGIGRWSDDDFRAATQLGIGKGGKHLYPAFPYTSFTLLADEDVLAIKAYLFSLKPVHAAPAPNRLRFPFDQRFLMAFWSWMFNPNARLATDFSQSAQWNRGRYLVEALGHCGECHTPRNILQALKSSEAYAGAVTQNWLAYNISSDQESGIGGWTDESLTSYLSTGYAQGHGPASGPMAEAVANSLRYLEPQDIHAMVVYLRSLKSIRTRMQPAASAVASAARDTNLEHGRRVYAGICANCHHDDGSGSQVHYEALRGSRSLRDPQAINLVQVVLHGSSIDTPFGHVSMPGFAHGYSDAEIAAVLNYASAQLGGQSAGLSPRDIAERR